MLNKRTERFAVIGATVGVIVALLASIRIVPMLLLTRSPPNLPVAMVLALYPVAGAVGGVVVAFTYPLTRWVGGAFLLGALALLPFFVGVALIDEHNLGKQQLIAAVVCAVALG